MRIIFHIDVNSAFLSWEAVDRLKNGEKVDLRDVPSVVGGDEKNRRGVVLAKSVPAKKLGIITGEPLFAARSKCPHLIVVPPRHDLYKKYSDEMVKILRIYSPVVERYSIDECFLDYSSMENHHGPFLQAAHKLKDHLYRELGFTVNVGIAPNKLLAKMASDLSKPNKVHTLFSHEIASKMWPLPVEELYMVGRSTADKLRSMGIKTIGELARFDVKYLERKLKSHGRLIWEYANGIDNTEVSDVAGAAKGISHSTTTPVDVTDITTAEKYLLTLTESVGASLREKGLYCSQVAVSIKDTNFRQYSHQRKLSTPTNSTGEIFTLARALFRELWQGQPLRLLGVRAGDLKANKNIQLTIFTTENHEKKRTLDAVVDQIRSKYGMDSIMRASLVDKEP